MLIDERKPKEDIAAQTYGRANDGARKWLAEQMKEWERTNKVNIVPMGATALKLDIPQSAQKSIDRSYGKGAAAGGAANKLKAKIGKQQWKDGLNVL